MFGFFQTANTRKSGLARERFGGWSVRGQGRSTMTRQSGIQLISDMVEALYAAAVYDLIVSLFQFGLVFGFFLRKIMKQFVDRAGFGALR